MKKVCSRCGCKSFISDRSLGGRIVCKRCGSSSIRNNGFASPKNKNFLFLTIVFVVLVIVIIL